MSSGDVEHRIAGSEYVPTAIYFEDSDSVEYIRRDVPCVYRRVDELLTLILAMDGRDPLGFQIKGFRHYYLRFVTSEEKSEDFSLIIKILQAAFTKVGDAFFDQRGRSEAYASALHIADEDKVRTPKLPLIAVS